MHTDDDIDTGTDLAVADRTANPFASAAGAVVPRGETSGARQGQSREMAEMQTKFLMAQHFPRDERRSLDGIINAFSRPGLAERSQYSFSRGGTDIAGPSIHAAQAIAQQWGNIEMGWREVSRGTGVDGVPYSEVEAFAIDLQGRVPNRIQFIVRHWRDTKKGGYKLKDERDIYEACASMAQRRKRACILGVLPQDVIDSAMEQADITLKASADASPEVVQKMLVKFAEFGVTREHIEKRIQRRIDAITPAQVINLRRIYASLKDDMSEPGEWFEMTEPAAAAAPAPAAATSADKAKDAIRQRAAVGGKKTEPPAGRALRDYMADIDNATGSETAALVLDEARSDTGLTQIDHDALASHWRGRWGDQ